MRADVAFLAAVRLIRPAPQSRLASLRQMQPATKAASPERQSQFMPRTARLSMGKTTRRILRPVVGFPKPRSGEEVGPTGSDAKREIVPSTAVPPPRLAGSLGDSDADSIGGRHRGVPTAAARTTSSAASNSTGKITGHHLEFCG